MSSSSVNVVDDINYWEELRQQIIYIDASPSPSFVDVILCECDSSWNYQYSTWGSHCGVGVVQDDRQRISLFMENRENGDNNDRENSFEMELLKPLEINEQFAQKLHNFYRKTGHDRMPTSVKNSQAKKESRMMASSWEESVMMEHRTSASLEQAQSNATGVLTPDQIKIINKRDVKYYFQHPYSRLVITYSVIFSNFLLFAEDPISHSHKESDIPIIGNVFSFVMTKYPPEKCWSLIKIIMWMLAMLCGMIFGKVVIHSYILGSLLRLKMFRADQGSWMTMFMTVIVSLFLFSHIYNVLLQLWYHDSHYQITSRMGVSNASVMKAAALGTWLGALITALMVTDMMLQDNLYPQWATKFRRLWQKSNLPRILIFWLGSLLATSIVVTLIVSDWISWDKLNKDLISTNEISRAFLASSILVMDLLIVMQDWDFPNFTTTLHVNLPGMNVATLKWNNPEVVITGKWFNYGIIFFVMMLDLNMWKNQIFYNPKDFGQYIGPDNKVRTVNEAETLRNANHVWTWELRSQINVTTGKPFYLDDAIMNSQYIGYPLSAKWTAFIPSIIALITFITVIVRYGRFPAQRA